MKHVVDKLTREQLAIARRDLTALRWHHYRSDIEGGKAHGVRIGSYTLAVARQDGAN